VLYRYVVEEVSRLHIIGAVDDQIAIEERFDISRVNIADERLDANVGVDSMQPSGGGDRLGRLLGHVRLVEQHLPLKIRQLDDVTVGNAQRPDAGSHQLLGNRAPERPAPHQQHARAGKLSLPVRADPRQQDLTMVTTDCHGFALFFRLPGGTTCL
jgi:hypothetical protein